VAGEAGIGKTRLVREFTDRARRSGAIVMRGECLESGAAGLPYGPIAQALNAAVSSGQLVPGALHAAVVEQLAILVPALAREPAGERAPFELAGLGQVRLFEALLATIEHISRDRPLVLVVEDLHWADRSTLDLLTFLVRNVAATPCLLVVTIRTDDIVRGGPLAGTLAELARRPSVERLDLLPFDLAATTAFLRMLLGEEYDDALAATIHRRSDGNPFFVEQLAWARQDGENAAVPPSLRDILVNHLSRQPPDVQTLLAAVAIAGPRVDEDLLCAILGWPEQVVVAALRQAVLANLLVPVRVATGEAYPFRHALMAEAVEADLLEGERRRLRTACADALQDRRPTDGVERAQWAARIAHHRDLAGDAAGTIAASLVAAQEAESVAAYQDALVQYRRALSGLERQPILPSPDRWDRAEIHMRAATCAAVAGEALEAARLSGLALAHLGSDADPYRRGAILVSHGEYLWLAGDDAFLEVLAMPARIVPAEPPTPERADALVSLGFHHKYVGADGAARAAWDEACTVAHLAGARRVEALATNCLAQLAMEAGDIEHAFRLVDVTLGILRQADPSRDTAVVYMDTAAVASWSGDDELAVRIAREGLALAQRHGFEPYYGGGLTGNAAEALWSLGRLAEAARLVALHGLGAAESFSEVGHHMARALVAIATGDLERARADLAACDGWLDRGDRNMRRFLRVVLAEWLLESGRPEEVEPIARAGVALPPNHAPWEDHCASLVWSWARAAADQAESARARRDVSAQRRAAASGAAALAALDVVFARPRHEAAPDRGRARAYAALAAAEHTRLLGRSEADAWRAAQRAWDGRSNVLRPLYARVREAEALLELGGPGRSEGVAVLREAHDLAVTYGAAQVLTMIEGLARRGRVGLAADAATAPGTPAMSTGASLAPQEGRPYGLTHREMEILGLLACGLTNRQIGERLFISPKTAGVHVSNILGKLDVGSRIQAATMAHHLGLETLEVPAGR